MDLNPGRDESCLASRERALKSFTVIATTSCVPAGTWVLVLWMAMDAACERTGETRAASDTLASVAALAGEAATARAAAAVVAALAETAVGLADAVA